MAARFFNKIKSGSQRLFSKIASDAPRILSKISNTLNDGGTILRKIDNTAKDVLSNPITQTLALGLGPEGEMAVQGANALLQNVGDVSKLSKQASNLTDASTYKGGTNAVSQDILQRATNLKGNANMVNQNIKNKFV